MILKGNDQKTWIWNLFWLILTGKWPFFTPKIAGLELICRIFKVGKKTYINLLHLHLTDRLDWDTLIIAGQTCQIHLPNHTAVSRSKLGKGGYNPVITQFVTTAHLINNVEANRAWREIDIWMIDFIQKANTVIPIHILLILWNDI